MKTLFNSLMLTIFCSFIGQVALRAQDGYGGHWFLGLNGGAAWQQSDVKTIVGGGGGFYLGKNIFYSPTAPLSFDLRFRYLGTTTFGQDFQTTNVTNNSTLNSDYAFVYHNHRTAFNDLSLEGRINFENLRRKNRIWLSLYGGAGLGIYGVRYDQLDGDWVLGSPYTNLYNTISSDPTLSKDEIVNQILANRDGEYETPMHGQFSNNLRATFTPNVGIELGYWITKRFAIGVGHRVNWTFKDDFDGVIRGNGNNIHHYANLFMHFKISGNASGQVIRNNDPINPPLVDRPTVDITTPNQSPYTTGSGTTRIACTIRNVETRSGVMMYVNNIAVNNYSFSPNTDILDAFVSLNIGANTVRITGTNAAGTAEDNVTIIYQQNVVNPPNPSNPPTVNITQPTANPYSTQNASENIRATITNVAGMNNVTLTVNGQNIRNFTLTGTSFNASGIALQQGTNAIVISASNNDGNASDQVNIIYQPAVSNPPTVNITQPTANPYSTQNASENIRATITNVAGMNNVTFTVNGQNIRNFTLTGTSFNASGIALQQGTNSIVISASNNDGNASDQVTINYQPVIVAAQPTVNITQPSANPFTSTSATANIRATITNVPSRSNVNFFVNGQPQSNFSFSGTSFTADNVVLQQGSNNILISASNQSGTASDQTVINYQPVRTATPPTVVITNPTANPLNIQVASQSINATITNVNSAANVSFTINGVANNNFTLNGTSFTANNVIFSRGTNTVIITANNQDGTASDQTVINYQATRIPTPPTVTITNPTANPLNIQVASQNINATITNVNSAANVSFTINGVANNNFTLNGTSFTANNVIFGQGSNTVVISATNQDGTASDQTVVNYQPVRTATPPTVVITNPTANPLNIQVASQNINATITNVNSVANVSFTINGVPNNNFTLNGTSFTANNVIFGQGSNTVVISATNQDGTASDQTVINYQPVKETLPPTVTITNPTANPLNSQSATQNISATITNVRRAANVTFTINGVANTNFTFSGTSFTASNVTLNQGANNIVITASNTDGTASDQTVINYQPVSTPKPPTVIITNPANEVSNSGVANVAINATILNINNASGVTFTVNGQQNNNFTLSGTSFSANNVQLNEGSNNIVIRATNQDGNASDNASITYTKPQDVRVPTPPTVVITNPSTDPFTTTNATAVINATVTNVLNAQNVTFTVNGQNVRNFSLSGTSFSASGINLNPGNNTFVVSATNKDGNASDNATIVYNAPVQPPVVTITTPSTNPYNSSTNTTSIRATILNVANASGVSFMVNGQYVTNFTFNGTNFSASNLPLNNGTNNFTITGNNSAGSDVKSTVINYTPQPAPSIGDMSVAVQPANTGCTVTVYAGLSNVSNINQITFKINGVVTRGFTFQNNVFNYSYNVTSNNPSTINYEITVNNGGGTATQTRSANVANCSVQAPPDVRNGNVQISMQNGSCIATITAQLVNVDNNSQIRFTANGRNTNFTNTNGSFTATVDLTGVTSSSISFVISATTPGGSDSETLTGNLSNCASRPQISNMGTAHQIARAGFEANVTANISGVQNANQISFKVNGVSSTDFNFSNGRFTATAIPISEGKTTFSITATNSAGSDTESREVNIDGGSGNRPVDNTEKGKDGKGNKLNTDKPAENKPAEVKPENKTNKGGKLGTDKKEGGL